METKIIEIFQSEAAFNFMSLENFLKKGLKSVILEIKVWIATQGPNFSGKLSENPVLESFLEN